MSLSAIATRPADVYLKLAGRALLRLKEANRHFSRCRVEHDRIRDSAADDADRREREDAFHQVHMIPAAVAVNRAEVALIEAVADLSQDGGLAAVVGQTLVVVVGPSPSLTNLPGHDLYGRPVLLIPLGRVRLLDR